jgi:hypothetical protein
MTVEDVVALERAGWDALAGSAARGVSPSTSRRRSPADYAPSAAARGSRTAGVCGGGR